MAFGKASLSMAAEVLSILGPDSVLPGSVISAPKSSTLPNPVGFEVHRGAADNLPDQEAATAAGRILEEVSNVNACQGHIVLALVSGGGSALLPAPIDGLDLDTKTDLIRNLHTSGASIQEVNTVRTVLSKAKGGRLAEAATAPLVSLIISDVVGDPLDLIASGPTVPLPYSRQEMQRRAWHVMEKYNVHKDLPQAVQDKLKASPDKNKLKRSDLFNFIIANNWRAVQAFACHFQEFVPASKVVMLQQPLTGDCRELGSAFGELALFLDGKTSELAAKSAALLGWNDGHWSEWELGGFKHFCVVGGGETTAVVRGRGKGGRNQEMALVVAQHLNKVTALECVFMSSGTDGIDGPTCAAGAIVDDNTIDRAEKLSIDPEAYLANNDSYNFFKLLNDHVITGHTGTNVMDLQVLWITKK